MTRKVGATAAATRAAAATATTRKVT